MTVRVLASSRAREVRSEGDTQRGWDPPTFTSDGSIPDTFSAASQGDSTLVQAGDPVSERTTGRGIAVGG